MGLPVDFFVQHLTRESELLGMSGQGRKGLERVIADSTLVERVRDQFFGSMQGRGLAGVLALLDLTDRGHRLAIFELLAAHRGEILQLCQAVGQHGLRR